MDLRFLCGYRSTYWWHRKMNLKSGNRPLTWLSSGIHGRLDKNGQCIVNEFINELIVLINFWSQYKVWYFIGTLLSFPWELSETYIMPWSIQSSGDFIGWCQAMLRTAFAGSICQRFASLNVDPWNRWNSEHIYRD